MESSNKQKAGTIFRWTIKKYLPVSIAYWVLLFLSLPVLQFFTLISVVSVPNRDLKEYISQAVETPQIMILFILVTIVMSTIISFVTFSYMHNKRCVDFFGSLPVSRRTMFFSRYMAVVAMLILPIIAFGVLGAVLTLSINGFLLYLEILALIIPTIIGNISLIAFISLCSGTVVDMVISFLALNITYPICITICGVYPTVVLPGMDEINLEASVFTFFSPMVAPYTGVYGNCKVMHCIWWIFITVVLCAGCFFSCKKRKAETAQNSFTFSVLSNTIKFIMCFAAGFGIGWILSHMGVSSESLEATYIWFFIGLFIGVMVTNFMLHLIFYKGLSQYASSLKLCGGVFVVATVFLFSVTTGGFGYDEYVPEANQVRAVSVVMGNTEFYVNGKNILERYSDDAKVIDEAIAFHKNIVEAKTRNKYQGVYLPVGYSYGLDDSSVKTYDGPSDKYAEGDVRIIYRLKKGKTVSRYYNLLWKDEVLQDDVLTDEMYSDIKKAYLKIPAKYLLDNVDISVRGDNLWDDTFVDLDYTKRKELLNALRKDYKAVGLIEGTNYSYDYDGIYEEKDEELSVENGRIVYFLDLSYIDSRGNYLSVSWAVDKTYRNTIEVMEKYQMLNFD